MSEMKKLDASLWCNLGDDLLEKIIARLPFKSLYRAASLSKAWRLRVLSHSFQSEVQGSNSSWKSYAPVYVNQKKELLGYESSSKRLHRLPNHNFLNLGPEYNRLSWWVRAGHGPLLCCSEPLYREKFLITNPLTKTWKVIPSNTVIRDPKLVHIVCEGSTGYRLTLGTRRKCWIDVQIYDSVNESWTKESYDTGMNKFKLGGWVYINGVFHMLVRGSEGPPMNVISLDVTQKIWKKVKLDVKQKVVAEQAHPSFFHAHLFDIVVCGSHVLLVVYHRDEGYTKERLSVFRVDLQSGVAWEVSRAPPAMLESMVYYRASGHDDCIYFGSDGGPWLSILYNVVSNEWLSSGLKSHFHLRMYQTSITYEPGFNPFLKV